MALDFPSSSTRRRIPVEEDGNQTGSFGINFASEGSDETEKVLKWRAALKETADLSGVHVNDHKPEAEFIDEIVAKTLGELKPMLPLSNTSKILVGINHHIEKIEGLLCMNSEVVCTVGIWGMGGIGKTTIAKSVFARIARQFDGYCFFDDIRGEIAKHGKGFFWNKFFSEGLVGKRVFIVYDAVDDLTSLQIQELEELNHSLGGGSKILMTSRDKHVLKKLNVDEVYQVVGLREEEALKLFSLMAFKNEFPPMRYLELCNRVVRSAQGNALALRALGSHFIGRDDENYWHSELEKIEGDYKKPIIELLRISYDALSPIEKEVFLDIIFFFKGENICHVVPLLNGIYDGVYSSMIHLIEKGLISISPENEIEIHDLMQQMGLEVANEDTNRRECKRLGNSKEIYRSLIIKKGIEMIEGISLNLNEGKNMSFEVDAFSKMVGLRWGRNDDEVLRLSDTHKEVLPFSHLRYLCWGEFQMKWLPSMFSAQNLIKISLRGSKVEQVWTRIQDLVDLKWVDLTVLRYLMEISGMSESLMRICPERKSSYLMEITDMSESLISICPERKIEIHDLMQQMGLEIRNEGANKRLCNSKEIEKTGAKEWAWVVMSFLFEGLSASFDQMGYTLTGMVMAYVALLLFVVELTFKARKKMLTWAVDRTSSLPRYGRLSAPAHNNSRNVMFLVSVVELFGLASAIWQCFYSTMHYIYKSNNPIKICLLPFLFVSCVIVSKCLRERGKTKEKSGMKK